MTGPLAYEFGGFRFDPVNQLLTCSNAVVRLTPKASETLLVLVQRPGQVVTKEELFTAVWPETTVEENNLNQQISTLRKALNQNGDHVVIETVPRRGYRLAGPVRIVPIAASETSVVIASEVAAAFQEIGSPPTESASVVNGRSTRNSFLWIGGATLAIAVAVASWSAWRWYASKAAATDSGAAVARGERLMRERNFPGAIAELQEAIRLDPTNARAYGVLAHALHNQTGVQPSSAVRPAGQSPSVQAAERSVALDPTCAECHGTLGLFLFYHDWDWVRAREHLELALRLAPEAHSIRPSYAMLLASTGDVTEALRQIDFALEKSPFNLTWLSIRASILYYGRHYEEAIAAADKALSINNRSQGPWNWRSKALFQLGRGGEAVHALAQDLFSDHSAELERAVREEGAEGGLRKLLSLTDDWRGRVEQAWQRATWRALLNDTEGSLDELAAAVRARRLNAPNFAVDPVYDKMRAHPRFQRLLQDVGLQDITDDAVTSSNRRR